MPLDVALLNAEISYARRRLDVCKLFTLSTGQNGRQKQLKRVGKQCPTRRFWVRPGRTSVWWDNFVNPQWIRSESEYVWTWNSIWIRCDHIACGRGYFRIRKEKVADSYIPIRFINFSLTTLNLRGCNQRKLSFFKNSNICLIAKLSSISASHCKRSRGFSKTYQANENAERKRPFRLSNKLKHV